MFDDQGNPKQSWRIPDYYLVDMFAGYRFKIKGVNMKFNISMLNLLDKSYISDAQNNDQYSGQTFNSSDARSATVFFGMGRRFMTSFAITF
jgi:outer membrane receptor protein involved in Fe transport